jgi:hypothetical protein
MKTLAILLSAFVLVAGGTVPMALAQDSSSQPPAAPAPVDRAPEAKPDATITAPKAPDAKVDVDVKTRADDAAGAASPRTGPERTGFFGLSPTAAIIVSVAVLLVVILAIVAMTNNRGTTYVDRDRL